MSDFRLGLYEKAMPSGLSFHHMLETVGNTGFDFMELSVDETDDRLARLAWTQEERKVVLAAMQDTGVPIRTMCLSGHRKYPLGSRDDAVRERGMEIMKHAVELADALGIRIIQLAGYDVYYEKGGEDTRRRFEEYLASSVRFAEQYGINLGFETMETPFMDTVGKAMRYVRSLNSPYLGVYPDLGNLTNASVLYGSDLYADLESGRGHIFAMHIKETKPGIYRDLRFGQGHVAFVPGIAKARNLGVSLFVAECWHDGSEDYLSVLRSVSEFVRGRFCTE